MPIVFNDQATITDRPTATRMTRPSILGGGRMSEATLRALVVVILAYTQCKWNAETVLNARQFFIWSYICFETWQTTIRKSVCGIELTNWDPMLSFQMNTLWHIYTHRFSENHLQLPFTQDRTKRKNRKVEFLFKRSSLRQALTIQFCRKFQTTLFIISPTR